MTILVVLAIIYVVFAAMIMGFQAEEGTLKSSWHLALIWPLRLLMAYWPR